MSDEAGQWAAMAMACTVFADGAAAEAEIAAARGQVIANPVLHESIGSAEAERIFKETVDAIAQIPSAMIPTYEIRLAGLAQEITEVNDKNFALTTVIAVSMSDRTLTAGEHQMLLRFQKMLGASIPVPEPGAAATPEVKQLQPVAPTTGSAAGCSTCGKPTQLYQGRGAWCGACQRFDATPAAPPKSSSSLGHCPQCGTSLVPYQGYGPYCSTCRQVVPIAR